MQREQWVPVAELLGSSLPVAVAVETRGGEESNVHDQLRTSSAPLPRSDASAKKIENFGLRMLWRLRRALHV